MSDRRKFEGDLTYEVWRQGGNPDAVHPDHIDDLYYDRHWSEEPEDMATEIVRRQRQ